MNLKQLLCTQGYSGANGEVHWRQNKGDRLGGEQD